MGHAKQKEEADPLHFSDIPSNFGDETTLDLLAHNTFPQNYVRKISDQEYDNCELQSESVLASMAFDEEEVGEI